MINWDYTVVQGIIISPSVIYYLCWDILTLPLESNNLCLFDWTRIWKYYLVNTSYSYTWYVAACISSGVSFLTLVAIDQRCPHGSSTMP